jgi:hypothetical protein
MSRPWSLSNARTPPSAPWTGWFVFTIEIDRERELQVVHTEATHIALKRPRPCLQRRFGQRNRNSQFYVDLLELFTTFGGPRPTKILRPRAILLKNK